MEENGQVLESTISFQLNSQTLVCRPLGEYKCTLRPDKNYRIQPSILILLVSGEYEHWAPAIQWKNTATVAGRL